MALWTIYAACCAWIRPASQLRFARLWQGCGRRRRLGRLKRRQAGAPGRPRPDLVRVPGGHRPTPAAAARAPGQHEMSGCDRIAGMSPATRPVRQRLDQLLVERGLAETRTRAQALILSGHVRVGEGEAARTDRKSGIWWKPRSLSRLRRRRRSFRGRHQASCGVRRVRGRACRARVPGRGVVYRRLHGPAAAAGRERVYAVDVGRASWRNPPP